MPGGANYQEGFGTIRRTAQMEWHSALSVSIGISRYRHESRQHSCRRIPNVTGMAVSSLGDMQLIYDTLVRNLRSAQYPSSTSYGGMQSLYAEPKTPTLCTFHQIPTQLCRQAMGFTPLCIHAIPPIKFSHPPPFPPSSLSTPVSLGTMNPACLINTSNSL